MDVPLLERSAIHKLPAAVLSQHTLQKYMTMISFQAKRTFVLNKRKYIVHIIVYYRCSIYLLVTFFDNTLKVSHHYQVV